MIFSVMKAKYIAPEMSIIDFMLDSSVLVSFSPETNPPTKPGGEGDWE